MISLECTRISAFMPHIIKVCITILFKFSDNDVKSFWKVFLRLVLLF